MTNSKKILITTECREIFIVHCVGNRAIHYYCEICEAETEMLTLDEAVIVANKTTRELIRRIESGAAHSTETASGYLLVCAASLLENGNSSKSG